MAIDKNVTHEEQIVVKKSLRHSARHSPPFREMFVSAAPSRVFAPKPRSAVAREPAAPGSRFRSRSRRRTRARDDHPAGHQGGHHRRDAPAQRPQGRRVGPRGEDANLGRGGARAAHAGRYAHQPALFSGPNAEARRRRARNRPPASGSPLRSRPPRSRAIAPTPSRRRRRPPARR